MSFWVGYTLGVSQNIVAAVILSPLIVKWLHSRLEAHHAKIVAAIQEESRNARNNTRK